MRDVLPVVRRATSMATGRGSEAVTITTRIAVAGVVGAILLAVLFLRLWALTVLGGDHYQQLSVRNQVRQVPIEAPRGRILDRNGHPFVINRPARQVVVDLRDVPPASMPSLIRDLAALLDQRAGHVRAKLRGGQNDLLTPVVLDDDVSDDDIVFYIEEHQSSFPGVSVRPRFVRSYVDGPVAAHILGQVGEVNEDQLKGSFANLHAGDEVGQTGLERTYDQYLRGTNGYRAVEVDAAGIPNGIGRGVPATPGSDLRLTIDLGLQRATEAAVRGGLQLGASFGANAGAAVAIDPRNGQVLAMASYPTYDPNIFVTPHHDKQISALLHDVRTPLTNRAVAGLYPSGSTFKPIVALAAEAEGIITPTSTITCPSHRDYLGTRFDNWSTQSLGPIGIAESLEISCDTFYYDLGRRFYNTKGSLMQDWAERFGLGTKTGIDLPSEQAGTVPTSSWRRKHFAGTDGLWGPGRSANLSIGQGDLLVTPLQMTNAYATIANGGTVHTPRLAISVDDSSGHVRASLGADDGRKLGFTDAQLAPIRQGLHDATHTSLGTGSAVFSTFPVDVAGKTGTAEKPPVGDMAWFCGYAPAANPTIAACAIIEKGGHGGTTAAPVVLRMMQAYFHKQGGKLEGVKTD